MSLPFLAQRVVDCRIPAGDPLVGFLLDQFARLLGEWGDLAVEVPADAVREWQDEPGLFMPTIASDPPAMCWIEYQWPRRGAPKRNHPDVTVPARVGVGFLCGPGLPHSPLTQGVAANIVDNGHDPLSTARTVTALVVVWLAEAERAEPVAVISQAFDGDGDEMGNRWFLMQPPRRMRRELEALARRVTDEQIRSQGLPGPVLMSGPAWRLLAAWAHKVKEVDDG